MKNFIYLMIGLSLLLLLAKNSEGQSKVLIKNIEYDVPILNEDLCNDSYSSETDWWKRNIEASKRWYFQQMILKKAEKGDMKIYGDDGKPLAKTDLEKRITKCDTITMTRLNPPYNTYDTIIMEYMHPSEIRYLRFRESWYCDTLSYKVTKKITEYAPVIVKDEYGTDAAGLQNRIIDTKHVPLFWVKSNSVTNDTKGFVTFTDLIEYNSPIDTAINKIWTKKSFNLISVSDDTNQRKTYIRSLINFTEKGKINAFNTPDIGGYYDFSVDTIYPLKHADVYGITNTADSVEFLKPYPPFDSYDSLVVTHIDMKSIKILRFHEKWFINKSTFEIKKEVIAITPCVEVLEVDGTLKGLKPLFTILFGKPYRCF